MPRIRLHLFFAARKIEGGSSASARAFAGAAKPIAAKNKKVLRPSVLASERTGRSRDRARTHAAVDESCPKPSPIRRRCSERRASASACLASPFVREIATIMPRGTSRSILGGRAHVLEVLANPRANVGGCGSASTCDVARRAAHRSWRIPNDIGNEDRANTVSKQTGYAHQVRSAIRRVMWFGIVAEKGQVQMG